MKKKKYRRFVKSEKDKLQLHLFFLVWLLAVFVFSLFFYLLDFFILRNSFFSKISFFIKMILFCVLILLSVLEIFLYKKREIVAVFEVGKMNKKATKMARKMKLLFTDRKIIDVLKLANKTIYGYEIPEVFVFFERDLSEGYIAFENIANFEIMDKNKYEQKMGGILNGKFQKYSIVSSELVNSDSYMLFHFEDTTTSKRFIVENDNYSKFVSDNLHHIKLAEDLTWYADLSPHFAIVARTRSGKTYLCRYMAEIMLLQNWSVEFNSTKIDNQVKKYNGYSDAVEIVERAEYYVNVMNERLKLLSSLNKEKYLEVETMNDIAVLFDEIGNLNASLKSLHKSYFERWTHAINKLSATGASAGIHIICCSQQGTLESFVPSLTRDNISDCVIMLGGSADSADERRYLMSGFADMPRRNYKRGTGLARLITSGRKWEVPHFFECPLIK